MKVNYKEKHIGKFSANFVQLRIFCFFLLKTAFRYRYFFENKIIKKLVNMNVQLLEFSIETGPSSEIAMLLTALFQKEKKSKILMNKLRQLQRG